MCLIIIIIIIIIIIMIIINKILVKFIKILKYYIMLNNDY